MASKASEVLTLSLADQGHRRLARALQEQRLLLVCLALFCVIGSPYATIGNAQEVLGPCDPSFVQQWSQPQVTPIAYRVTAATPEASSGAVRLEWLGHSSFVLTSPTGTRILTDPHAFYPLHEAPDASTISNLHVTHSDVRGLPGNPRVLWGITHEQGWNKVALMIGDIGVFNVPSYASRVEPEQSPIQNSIFAFRTGGLCLVHLGNLRHLLTPQQLQRLGRPDVVMVPADGSWTMSFEDVLTVIDQLRPALVIPMHIDTLQQALAFAQHTGSRYPVRQVPERSLTLSRQLLPAATTIVLFGGS
jgi:L-ascorbate metabolism protein UlaG (beta-lactamase superfamily)